MHHPLTPPNSLPFSQACENNKAPIFSVLQQIFKDRRHVLEVGSGTGQHSVFFSENLPELIWQPSDLEAAHAGILGWQEAHPSANLRKPLAFDVSKDAWPKNADGEFDAVFSANTLHIMAWPHVQRLFSLMGAHLPHGALIALYGPFNYNGKFTSDSNRAFDAMLRQRDSASGIRDYEAIETLAQEHGLMLQADHAMPANNRLLVLRKAQP